MRLLSFLAAFSLVVSVPLGCGADAEPTPDALDVGGDASAPTGSEADAASPEEPKADAEADGGACPFTPGAEPQKKVVFVDKYPDEDLDIEDEMVRLIRAAVPGSKIRVAVFTWTRRPISDALVEAHQRGVDVRAVADQSNLVEDPPGSGTYRYTAAVRVAKEGLGGDRLVLCNESQPPNGLGCIGTGINHNKLLLFSELCDGSKDVVVQSSANFTNPQLRAHNNSIILRDDPKLFATYESYWNDLRAQQTNLAYYRSADGDTGTKAYFYPRAGTTPSSDTIYRILDDNVECGPQSRIRIAMAFWTMARSHIVDILATKKAQGCDVKILADEGGTSDALKSYLASNLAASDFIIAKGIHHKYMLVESQYLGAPRRLVWTGSHNYTGPALRTNDEALLRVDDAKVFTAYLGNWDAMWKSYSP
jgi:phosphatidylserine/phosphatidylglycerophosphate/cardiolipin synthase-like enzyme